MIKESFIVQSLGACAFRSPLKTPFFVSEDAGVLVDATAAACRACKGAPSVMEMAGPRQNIFFDPQSCHAAVVTCGGLCPGLNDVIRATTMVLWYRYGVRKISGLRYGYEGLIPALGHDA